MKDSLDFLQGFELEKYELSKAKHILATGQVEKNTVKTRYFKSYTIFISNIKILNILIHKWISF